jgi:predicted Zn-dependent protease
MNAASMIERLRAQRGGPRDGALLRFALGDALLKAGDAAAARIELEAAVTADVAYSAAWKRLGEACRALDDPAGAAGAWTRGIEAARTRGDTQALREMQVFLRRLAPAAG